MAQAIKANKAQGGKPAKASSGKTGKVSAGKSAKKPNIFVRLKKYLREVWTELKRTTWPSRAEVIKSSGIVLATLVFFIVFTAIVDNISSFVFIEWLAGIGR